MKGEMSENVEAWISGFKFGVATMLCAAVASVLVYSTLAWVSASTGCK